jgi:RNA:NAD 2'-phosphotransferase (TPT1/KptA family)
VLPRWCDENQLRSIVVVTTKDHSRRLRRVLDRAMQGHATRVTVQTARHSTFDPDRWWETRGGTRIEIIELQKLLLDIALHPMQF